MDYLLVEREISGNLQYYWGTINCPTLIRRRIRRNVSAQDTESTNDSAFRELRDDFVGVATERPFRVFLCGPKMGGKVKTPAQKLRARIHRALKKGGFHVILGEDDGILNKEITRLGINAQDNELQFIDKSCDAIVIVAGSPGSFCELGLFSWHFSNDRKKYANKNCVVLIDASYEKHKSYLNLGPAKAVLSFGTVEFVDFSTYKPTDVYERLNAQRGVTAAAKLRRIQRGEVLP